MATARSDAASLRLERRVAEAVAEGGVLLAGESALLLLSGGADSMALLDLLPRVDRRLDLGLRLAALHVDYGRRGAESDRDREIVRRACAAAGVPLHVARPRRLLEGSNFQARAREYRYRRARELCAAHGYDVAVTAHNRDDQAETILYRLVKYASPRGFAGMRPRDRGLARPLLCLGAAEIRDHCARRGVEYGEDASNTDVVYARNLLRLEVLPLLERVNPRVAATLADTAVLAAAEADVLAAATAAATVRVRRAPEGAELAAFAVAALAAEPPALQLLVLHDAVREVFGGSALVGRRPVAALQRLLARPGGEGRVSLGRGLEGRCAGGRLTLAPAAPAHACSPAVLDGAALAAAAAEGVALGFCGGRYRAVLASGGDPRQEPPQISVGLEAPPRRLVLRHPRRGERFAPLGLGAETTMARFLAAAGVPPPARRRAVVVDVDGAAAALWFGAAGDPGGAWRSRVAHAHRVHESTEYTLHVTQEDP